VPFNRGQSYFENHCGFGADNIISARMVTAKGDLIDMFATSKTDLFWAIRGARQLFGVVTSLTLRAYPVSFLGITNDSISHHEGIEHSTAPHGFCNAFSGLYPVIFALRPTVQMLGLLEDFENIVIKDPNGVE
jgi:hypothetical protein